MTNVPNSQSFHIGPLDWLLVALPTTLVLKFAHADDLWIFLAACLAVVPLAGLMGRATENLAETMGPGVGGLLNATFGNAAELIIGLMVLWRGPAMYGIVKASLTGSIIGNILLVLGLAILAGGLRFKRQQFNRGAASMGTTLLALAVIGLIVPSAFHWLFHEPAHDPEESLARVETLSEEIAAILAIIYVLSLIFTLRTHSHWFAGPDEEPAKDSHVPEWGRRTALVVLLLATIAVAVMSELLAASVERAAAALGFNEVFVGVIVLAIIGNAAEHSTAVLMAMKNKMDLAVTIAISSSLQVALFVAPVLVFSSMLMGHAHPMDLHFSPFELLGLIAAVAVLSLVSNDGESHWFEGAMLLAVYAILALAFYHIPHIPHAPG